MRKWLSVILVLLVLSCVSDEAKSGVDTGAQVLDQISGMTEGKIKEKSKEVKFCATEGSKQIKAAQTVIGEPKKKSVVNVKEGIVDKAYTEQEIVESGDKAWTTLEKTTVGVLSLIGLGGVASWLFGILGALRRKKEELALAKEGSITLVGNIRDVFAKIKETIAKLKAGEPITLAMLADLDENVLKQLIRDGQLAADTWTYINDIRAELKEREVVVETTG